MNTIFNRVSIRKYQDKPIEDSKVELLLRIIQHIADTHMR